MFKSTRFEVSSQPGESEGDFRNRLSVAAREQRDAAVEKLRTKYAAKHATLTERIRKAEQAVDREAEQARGAKVQTAISLGSTILGAFLGRRKSAPAARPACCAASGARSTRRRHRPRQGDGGRAAERSTRSWSASSRPRTQEVDRTFDPVSEPLEKVAVGRRRPTSTCSSWPSCSPRTGSMGAAC